MFYNHGGGFVIGLWWIGFSNLARNFDVVVVQTNQRLGLLVFYTLMKLQVQNLRFRGIMAC